MRATLVPTEWRRALQNEAGTGTETVAPTPARSRGRALRIALAVIAVGVVAACLCSYFDVGERRRRFGVVEEGVLYRMAQPDRREIDRYVSRYGIKTVVNLRGPEGSKTDPVATDTNQYVRAQGLNLVFIPVCAANMDESVETFLSLLRDKANLPALVHCRGGKDRTGVLVGAYRLAVDRWDLQRTLDELASYGHRMEGSATVAYLQQYARRLADEKGSAKAE